MNNKYFIVMVALLLSLPPLHANPKDKQWNANAEARLLSIAKEKIGDRNVRPKVNMGEYLDGKAISVDFFDGDYNQDQYELDQFYYYNRSDDWDTAFEKAVKTFQAKKMHWPEENVLKQYRKGCGAMETRDLKNLKRAFALFSKAVHLDPEFRGARAGRSDALFLLSHKLKPYPDEYKKLEKEDTDFLMKDLRAQKEKVRKEEEGAFAGRAEEGRRYILARDGSGDISDPKELYKDTIPKGSTIIVREGTYDEFPRYAGYTFIAEGKVIVRKMHIFEDDNVAIDGFRFENDKPYETYTAIQIDGSHHITIRNCHFRGYRYGAVTMDKSSDVAIEHCWINGNGGGVTIEQAENSRVRFCQIGPGEPKLHGLDRGINIEGPVKNVLIQGNTFVGRAFVDERSVGIYAQTTSGFQIKDNIIAYHGDIGLKIALSGKARLKPDQVVNNVFYDNSKGDFDGIASGSLNDIIKANFQKWPMHVQPDVQDYRLQRESHFLTKGEDGRPIGAFGSEDTEYGQLINVAQQDTQAEFR